MRDESQLLTAASEDAGVRIDLFAASRYAEVSRAEAQRLIEMDARLADGIRVNGARVKQNYRLKFGDVVSLIRPAPTSIDSKAMPENILLDIVYEDSQLLVINKSRGMVVHPAPGSASGTLVNAVLAHSDDLSGIGGEIRPGIVHRLDKDTGGLLVVAKSDAAHRSLQAQIQARTAERRYKALLWGVPAFERATVEAAIGRHPADRKKMAVITDAALTSRSAVTELQLLSAYAGIFSLWDAKLQTGRTHQIRVHCAYIRHPVVGDALYGGVRRLAARRTASRKSDTKWRRRSTLWQVRRCMPASWPSIIQRAANAWHSQCPFPNRCKGFSICWNPPHNRRGTFHPMCCVPTPYSPPLTEWH